MEGKFIVRPAVTELPAHAGKWEAKMEDWIETYTGRRFRPLNPRPEDVCVEDIAHALSLICRFNGQCRYFYSVGQHSLLCCELARNRGYDKRVQLLALLHDAAEAYVSDVARPIKPFLADFNKIEASVQKAIWRAFSIGEPTWEEKGIIKELDLTLLATEGRVLMPFKNWTGLPYPPAEEIHIDERSPSEVEKAFTVKFYNLTRHYTP